MTSPFAQLIEVLPLTGVGKRLTYGVPPAMRSRIQVGMLVRVPLHHRHCLALVASLESNQQIPPDKLKYVLELLYDCPVATPDMLKLAEWMHAYYAAPIESVYEAMIPATIREGGHPKLIQYLSIGNRRLTTEELGKLEKRAPKQAALYRFLLNQFKPLPKKTVLERLKVNAASCEALIERGCIQISTETEMRDAYRDDLGDAEAAGDREVLLNDEQEAAFQSMAATLDSREYKTHLLHGVTGSGKTEVYLKAIRKVLSEGGGVIFLVPEVALTPQTVGRLRSRLEQDGTHIVVWHSHLSAGERFDAWMALARGEARVVVGARSAIFAPIRDLRLIVVDEEHEPAYKQSESPRYHGRDIAVYRSYLCQALCVLGSATPSLETLYNVEIKRYHLNRLTKRIDDRELPKFHIVDMRREKFSTKGAATLSQLLTEKLIDRFEKQEQSILFINRRGYSNSMLCQECGHVAMCPHCDVSLTFHRTDNRLRCHVCGHQERAPTRCPKCSSPSIRWRGFGTQRVEESVRKLLPRAKIVRMDADTMVKKHLYREILNDFRKGKIHVLIGTQMIAKGLDFPNVTLVGMIDADISLHVPDFRANERAFQLLVQVAGRAGRGDRAGEVVVQTYAPHSPPIQYSRRADFEAFLHEELDQRREYHYPPFRHLVRHLFRGRNPEKVMFYAEQWSRHLESRIQHQIEIRGPAPAPLEKIKDIYRFHIWYFVDSVSRILPDIVELRKQFPMDEEVVDVFDVDPMDMM